MTKPVLSTTGSGRSRICSAFTRTRRSMCSSSTAISRRRPRSSSSGAELGAWPSGSCARGSRRAQHTSDGSTTLPAADRSCDRFVSTYVLDLLSEDDIRAALRDARRVLVPSGRLCLASLTTGHTPWSRTVCRAWTAMALSSSGRRDSNPRRQPWQGCTLPLSYSRVAGGGSSGGRATSQGLASKARARAMPSWTAIA